MASTLVTERGSRWPVWDLVVRVIHWYFPLAIAFMWWTGEEGKMTWHSWCGYSLIVAVSTRIIWGIVGSEHARFTTFLRGPRTIWAYITHGSTDYVGHNPLGGWSTLVLLSLMLAQGISGLMSANDVAFEGPLAYWAGDFSASITELHETNWGLLQGFIALHLGAIIFYQWYKKDRLIQTMWRGQTAARFAQTAPRPWWLGLLLAAVLAIALAVIIYIAPEAPSYY